MNDFVVIFTSVLSSGVVAAVISALLTEAKERWTLRRSKIEEIYFSGSTWGDQHLKMKMNIEIYERSLVPALRLVEQELGKLNDLRSALKNCYIRTGQASEFLTPLNNQLLAFGSVGDSLIAAVVQRGVEIGAERGQTARAYAWASVTTCGCAERIRRLISKGWAPLDAYIGRLKP